MKSIGSLLIAILLVASAAPSETENRQKQESRLQNAGVVMQEVLNMPYTIPQSI